MVFSGGVFFGRTKGAAASESPALIPSAQNDKSDAYEPVAGSLRYEQTTADILSAQARVAEADALRELAVSGHQEEVKRLKGELTRARARAEEAPASLRAQLAAVTRELAEERRESARKTAEVTDLRGQVTTLTKTLSEEERQRAKELGRELAEEKRKSAEQAARIAELETELRRTREAGARCGEERERLNFALAFNGQVRSIPRSFLASAPESLLYRMYCGEWEYARDEAGRALVTCHPDRWTAVLEHLATGAVPAEWDPQLLAQARHWNLTRLVEGLEALSPGVVVTNDPDGKGFRVRCTFVSVMSQLNTGAMRTSTARLEFAGGQGRWWGVHATRFGIFLGPVKQPGETKIRPIKVSSCKWRILLRTEDLEYDTGCTDYPAEMESSYGPHWNDFGFTLHQLLTEPSARARDSLVVEVEARFTEL